MRLSLRDGAVVLAILYVIVSSIAFACGIHKDISTEPDKDRTYYQEFYTHIWHAGLLQHPSSPPNGTNIIYGGPDGAAGFNAAIHFEPIKYVAAAVFDAFGTIHAVEIFYILLFFMPLLYGAYLLRSGTGGVVLFVCMAAYAISPAALPTAVDDLRPYIALLPALLMFFISVRYARPAREQLLFLNLLLAVREEGLFLALPVLAYTLARDYLARGSTSRTNMLLCANWLAWLGIESAYYTWLSAYYSVRGGWLALYRLAAHRWYIAAALCAMLAGLAYGFRRVVLRVKYLPELLLAGPFVAALLASPFLGLSQPPGSPGFLIQDLSGRFGIALTVTALMIALACSPNGSAENRRGYLA
ncbi:MAG TPA: hypothetical protein VG934_03190 [Candidatus Paceibacterota bacterium]|nr:hypothetical protein [Candidatus Paceibacterota bacterium]